MSDENSNLLPITESSLQHQYRARHSSWVPLGPSLRDHSLQMPFDFGAEWGISWLHSPLPPCWEEDQQGSPLASGTKGHRAIPEMGCGTSGTAAATTWHKTERMRAATLQPSSALSWRKTPRDLHYIPGADSSSSLSFYHLWEFWVRAFSLVWGIFLF